ncbi:hypothetical protein [Catenuloplanes atrovinosus]|uniref:Uncharacterized protein n=1 Tax=Catenuloplanes atrovinosus TaxID=137266 RepID=A0AAE3YS02_9ACTN|nr:hypothetical protein [Catenuloplanes atrovinosus]MDR7277284.1 hypothetical protein [Catenuloplanes atrovinosus]
MRAGWRMLDRHGTRQPEPADTTARLPDLFDLPLARTRGGDLRVPDGRGEVTAERLAGIVRDTGGHGHDVRVIVDHGDRDGDLFRELAALLDRDVYVTPANAVARRLGPDRVFAVEPVRDEIADWVLIQPPAAATSLPGWFALRGGTLAMRTGVVVVQAAGAVGIGDRAGFVRLRAAVERLGARPDELLTAVVPAGPSGFRAGTYEGTDLACTGEDLASALSWIRLYGGDLRLWLDWPGDRAGRETLDGELSRLADVTGATVWVPPLGGSVRATEDGTDLLALGPGGDPDEWWPYRPVDDSAPSRFRTAADGRLRPVGDDAPRPAPDRDLGGAPDPVEDPGGGPDAALTDAGPLPPGTGLSWLPADLPGNSAPLTLWVPCDWPVERVVLEGLPTARLFIVGVAGETAPAGPHVRVHAAPGAAVSLTDCVYLAPLGPRAELTPAAGRYLIPAGRLDRVRLADTEVPGALVVRSTGARHGVDGLPEEVVPWPAAPREVYALLPDDGETPPDPLPLLPEPPPVRAGHRLVRLRVPTGGGIDVTASLAALAPLTSVRTRLWDLRLAGAGPVLPPAAYPAVTVTGVSRAADGAWVAEPWDEPEPLAEVLR